MLINQVITSRKVTVNDKEEIESINISGLAIESVPTPTPL